MDRHTRIWGLCIVGLAAAVLIVLAAVQGAQPAAAQLAPRDQTDADVIYMSVRREFIVVWSEDRGSGYRLFARRVRANGLTVGGPNGGEWELTRDTLPGGGKGDQRWPALADGLVVWSERAPGGDYDIYAQKLFSNARARGRPTLVVGGPGDQKQADVVPSRANEWLLVWSENTRDAGDITGVRLSTTLAPRGSKIAIAQGQGVTEDPTVAIDPNEPHYALVLWTDDRMGNLDIYGTAVAVTGFPRGGGAALKHFAVVDSPEDDYSPALLTAVNPGVLAQPGDRRPDRDTRNLLMWTHDDVTDGPDVLALRIRSNGYGVGNPIDVATGPGVQKWPAAALKPAPGVSRPGLSTRSEWLTVWHADPLGTLDVFGVEIGLNGLSRRGPRPLAND